MNELFGVEPTAYETASELRLLLAGFGPFTGKYVLPYPSDSNWHSRVLQAFDGAGDIERERIKSVIQRAKQNSAFVNKPNLPWQEALNWAENAINLWASNEDYKKVLLSDVSYDFLSAIRSGEEMASATRASELEHIGSADQQIGTSPEDYWRVSKVLCFLSHDIHFVDPYLNPFKTSRKFVLERFILGLSTYSKIKRINFWVRKYELANKTGQVDETGIEQWIQHIYVKLLKKVDVVFNLLDDEASKDKLHARYLLTDKGGIKFDQGFQQLSAGRINVASPIGIELHQKLYRQLIDGTFDFEIARSIKAIPAR